MWFLILVIPYLKVKMELGGGKQWTKSTLVLGHLSIFETRLYFRALIRKEERIGGNQGMHTSPEELALAAARVAGYNGT